MKVGICKLIWGLVKGSRAGSTTSKTGLSTQTVVANDAKAVL